MSEEKCRKRIQRRCNVWEAVGDSQSAAIHAGHTLNQTRNINWSHSADDACRYQSMRDLICTGSHIRATTGHSQYTKPFDVQCISQFDDVVGPVKDAASDFTAGKPVPRSIDCDKANLRVISDTIRQPGFQARPREPVKIKNRFSLSIAEFGITQPTPVIEGNVF